MKPVPVAPQPDDDWLQTTSPENDAELVTWKFGEISVRDATAVCIYQDHRSAAVAC